MKKKHPSALCKPMTISLPQSLIDEIKKLPRSINISKICIDAITKEIEIFKSNPNS